MIDLPEEFLNRMKKLLGQDFQSFLNSYNLPAERGIRVNTLKISTEDFEKISPLALDKKIPWCESGYYVRVEKPGKTILHNAGLYYVQEPSAMSVASKLEVNAGERVLDLCSAPGGKGTQIAQYMNGGGLLVLNEINFSRCGALASNVERLGVKNAVITSKPPKELAEDLTGFFDKILVDAPCSGEGMFKKEQNAIPEWSLENVKTCAERQAEILNQADKMLAGGGRLVYSTCTFAPEEDEEQIENFLKSHANYKLLEMKKLLPHEVRGEGHFYAVLQKTSGGRSDEGIPTGFAPAIKQVEKLFNTWTKDVINIEIPNIYQRGTREKIYLYSLPEQLPPLKSPPVACGVQIATVNEKSGKIEPAHALAMCLKKGEAKSIEVDGNTALNYLKGLTFECDPSEKGWRIVTHLGFPLGWCKAVNGTAKNHLPKGLRI